MSVFFSLWRYVFPVVFLFSAPSHADLAARSFSDLAERLLPIVVNVSTVRTSSADNSDGPKFEDLFDDFFQQDGSQRPRRSYSLGSGFIIDSAGYIVTNNHVIADADEITVRLQDETELHAVLVGRDSATDLALLKVEADTPLPAGRWGDSSQSRIGDWILAIGNPFGLGGSVSAGIVSARHRDIQAGRYDNFIQTDAAINRGNSGGPMFNTKGEIIGVNTAIVSPSGGSVGVGFAIPSSLARDVIAQLREDGQVARGWLGVQIQSIDPELAEALNLEETRGVLVTSLSVSSPAEKAGIQEGDIIVRFDSHDIRSPRQLSREVAGTAVGERVAVEVWRDGEALEVLVVLGQLDEAIFAAGGADRYLDPLSSGRGFPDFGFRVADITKSLRQKYAIPLEVEGPVITAIDPSGPAASKNLEVGTVILKVGRKDVQTVQQLQNELLALQRESDTAKPFFVYRNGSRMWVALRTKTQ